MLSSTARCAQCRTAAFTAIPRHACLRVPIALASSQPSPFSAGARRRTRPGRPCLWCISGVRMARRRSNQARAAWLHLSLSRTVLTARRVGRCSRRCLRGSSTPMLRPRWRLQGSFATAAIRRTCTLATPTTVASCRMALIRRALDSVEAPQQRCGPARRQAAPGWAPWCRRGADEEGGATGQETPKYAREESAAGGGGGGGGKGGGGSRKR